MRVLVSAYICNPYRGSEGGMSWNWAWHLSAQHEVWVLTQPRSRPDIERYLEENPNENLNFIWVNPPPIYLPWDRRKLIRLRYWFWLTAAYRAAARAHETHGFDVAHHVSYSVFFPPPELHRLPIPFVWGPVGGAMTAPEAFLSYFGRHFLLEAVRNLRVRLSCQLPVLKRAIRGTALLLATNRETARRLGESGAENVRLFLDVVPSSDFKVPEPRPAEPKQEVVFMWAGWLHPRKALSLGIEALARVKHLPIKLLVVGEGPMRTPWRRQAAALGVDHRLEFVGEVPWHRMRDHYRKADAFLFTSLRDSFGGVVCEAMASSLPILTLDHQGVGTFVPADAAIKVPVTTPEETVTGLAEGFERLAGDPELRACMGAAGWRFINSETWEHRVEKMTDFYHEILERRSGAEPAAARRPLALAKD